RPRAPPQPVLRRQPPCRVRLHLVPVFGHERLPWLVRGDREMEVIGAVPGCACSSTDNLSAMVRLLRRHSRVAAAEERAGGHTSSSSLPPGQSPVTTTDATTA